MSELEKLTDIGWWELKDGFGLFGGDVDLNGARNEYTVMLSENFRMAKELQEARRVIESVVIVGRFKDHEIALSAISNIFNMAENFITIYPDPNDLKGSG